jgi:hypothetical protein
VFIDSDGNFRGSHGNLSGMTTTHTKAAAS